MKITRLMVFVPLLVAFTVSAASAELVAKIRRVDGSASILRKGGEKWMDAKVGMPLAEGDQFCTRSESFAEILYHDGALVRLDENSKITIVKLTEGSASTSTPLGNVWVNAKKLVNGKRDFQLSSPTATAAIRGTVFQMKAAADSSTDVSVYNGKVAVGPKKSDSASAPPPADDFETTGPEEVPPPYEVSLDQWRMIVAGQVISIHKDGSFSQNKIDPDKAKHDAFVKKNESLDATWEKEK